MAMAKFVVSRSASAQPEAIYEFTDARMGNYQAEAYLEGFNHIFNLLADFPRIGVHADEFRVGLRRHRYQSHYIFYTEEADHIFIRDIFHVSQNLRPSMFD